MGNLIKSEMSIKLKRHVFHHGTIKQWLVVTIVICLILVFHNFVSNLSVFNDTSTRNQVRELEIKNNLLMMQLGFSHNLSLYLANNPNNNKNEEVNKCETIHIAIVCTGYRASRIIVTLLKSILYYRKHPLHFHFMSDEVAEQILSVLFETWSLPQVDVSFYSIRKAVYYVKWIPNNHYSGIYGLLKLTIPKVLPENISKVIVLDIDLTFMSDIYELWIIFQKFNRKQAIGVVENQSNWYLKKTLKRWPAIGRGFNTGVMLLDLKQLKRFDWSYLWRDVALETLNDYAGTGLADQDVFNAVIKKHSYLLYTLSCQWNVQLSDFTLSEFCYNHYDTKIIHWNSPNKLDVKNKHIQYFKSIHFTFLEYNGNLLQGRFFGCDHEEKVEKSPYTGECSEFHNTLNFKWRTHIYIRDYSYPTNENGNDVTLVTQLSIDRLQIIENVCKHWSGPVSVVLYLTDLEVEDCIDYIENSDTLKDRTNIAYHVIYKQGSVYPVNLLRNVGMKYVNTRYVFMIDIDFLPMYGLYPYIRKYILSLHNDLGKKALIIPAFQTQSYRIMFPKNKTEVLKMLNEDTLHTFRFEVWPRGHVPTNFTYWRNATVPYKVNWEPDFEPYYVVDRTVVPKYDTRFVGFGWNKVSHTMELEALDYDFIVAPDAFIIHMPHTPSKDIARFRNSKRYRQCLKFIKVAFVKDLQTKYNKTFYLPDGTITE